MVQSLDHGQAPPNDIHQMTRDFQSSTDILCRRMNQSKASLGIESSWLKSSSTRDAVASRPTSFRDSVSAISSLKTNRLVCTIIYSLEWALIQALTAPASMFVIKYLLESRTDLLGKGFSHRVNTKSSGIECCLQQQFIFLPKNCTTMSEIVSYDLVPLPSL